MWIIFAIILLLVIAVIITYNRLVKARNRVDEAWSGIEVQLKRRHDLIPNLVETVKGYSHHERQLLEDIASLRGRAMSTDTLADHGSTEVDLSRQLKTLFAVAEAYPDLKADKNFRDLQRSLVEIEDQIQFARRYFNGSVRDLNILVQSFPNNLIAGPLGFRSRDFFEIELATERQAPEMDFERNSQ